MGQPEQPQGTQDEAFSREGVGAVFGSFRGRRLGASGGLTVVLDVRPLFGGDLL